jgi:hypothetical protein
MADCGKQKMKGKKALFNHELSAADSARSHCRRTKFSGELDPGGPSLPAEYYKNPESNFLQRISRQTCE